MPVDPLSGKTNHVAKFALRGQHAAAVAVGVAGQREQRFRQALLGADEGMIRQLLAGPPQPSAQDRKEPDGQHREVVDEGKEIAPLQQQKVAACRRDRVGRARPIVEKSNFAENLVRADQIHD